MRGNREMKNWKKKVLAGLAVLALAGAAAGISGCGGGKQEAQSASAVRTITDIKGNQVTLPEKVSKIAVTPIPWASIVYALDGGSSERIAAVHPSAMSAYKGSLFEKLDTHFGTVDTKMIGQDFSMNAESMVNAGIQASLIWPYQEKDAEKLKNLGITPIMINNDTMDTLKKSFLIVGEVLGKKDKAEQLNAYYDNAYNTVTAHKTEIEHADKPVILFLRNKKLQTQGNDNFMHEVMEIGGAYNPVPQTEQAAQNSNKTVSMEEVYQMDPDIIFLSNFDKFVPDDLYENRIPGQDWSSVKAVKNHKVYKVPMGLYRWDAPGVETPLMMKWIAHTLHPEIFTDIHMREETKAFYKNFLNLQVSDDDLALVFADEANKNSQPVD